MSDDLVGAPPPRILHDMPIADPQEVLVLTYTSDLPFFEDVCVRQARARGARVTIVYDANNVEPGLTSGTGPITDYVPVPVVCRSGGAFHPKLVVIASATDALISIGSGNATPQGWHHSAEIWTHLRVDSPTVPAVVDDLATWLRSLADQLWISELGGQRLQRVADLLTSRPTQSEPDEPMLLTNDRVPIAKQLRRPDAPVDWLGVASPFFDPPATALAYVLTTLQPGKLDVLITRDAQLNPARLSNVLTRVDSVRVLQPVANRYHHGKVLEWWTGDSGILVTGSANCTQAALLRSMADVRGNCELGLLQVITDSLLEGVDAEEVDLADIELRETSPEPEPPQQQRILGVQILTDPDRIEITLLVSRGAAPEHLLLELPAQHVIARRVADQGAIYTYRLDGAPGALARTVTVRGDDGTPLGAALVVDVRSALSRAQHPSPLERQSLPDLLGDEQQMRALLDALRELAKVLPPRSEDDDTPAAKKRRRARAEEDIRQAVGSALLALALGAASKRTPASGDDTGEMKGDDALEGDEREQPASKRKGPALSMAAAIQARTERQRQHARTWFARLIEESAVWPLAAQLASFRSLLMAVGGGLWPHPPDWAWLVSEGLNNLWDVEDETLAEEHAALAVIGLTALRHGTLSHQADPELQAAFDDTLAKFREFREWALAPTDDMVARYAEELSGYTLGPRFTAVNIRADVTWLLDRDELDDALDLLDGVVDEVQRADNGAVIARTDKDPKRTVIAVLDRLREFPGTHVVVLGSSEIHGWWDGRRLMLAKPAPTGWEISVWRNLMVGIAGFAGARSLPAPTQTARAADPADAWAELVGP
ncbi:hypothetical protein ACPCHT_28530 [Nucisporomicrobium flavum]|uniref:hypothetical protein n=1 Tax=Nucisporomicrobium flavum TaxID=2785915 RepID=UPI003C30AF88